MSEPKDIMPLPLKEVLNKLQLLQWRRPSSPYINYIMRYIARPESGYFRETDSVMPEIFLMMCEQCLADCERGINSRTQERIPSHFGGCPTQLYRFVRLDLPAVADEVFPPDFAAEVKEALKDVEEAVTKAVSELPKEYADRLKAIGEKRASLPDLEVIHQVKSLRDALAGDKA